MTGKKELPLLTRTINLIKKAKENGFEMDHEIHPVMFESWMNAEKTFCNTACAILSMWLREMDIYIAVAKGFGGFSFFVEGLKSGHKPHNFGDNKTWEDAWLSGIEEALRLMPK